MQPSDQEEPFNYLAIQGPEDTSVGKSSTIPWRNRKEDVMHSNFVSIIIIKLWNFTAIAFSESGRLSCSFCQSVKSLWNSKANLFCKVHFYNSLLFLMCIQLCCRQQE